MPDLIKDSLASENFANDELLENNPAIALTSDSVPGNSFKSSLSGNFMGAHKKMDGDALLSFDFDFWANRPTENS